MLEFNKDGSPNVFVGWSLNNAKQFYKEPNTAAPTPSTDGILPAQGQIGWGLNERRFSF